MDSAADVQGLCTPLSSRRRHQWKQSAIAQSVAVSLLPFIPTTHTEVIARPTFHFQHDRLSSG